MAQRAVGWPPQAEVSTVQGLHGHALVREVRHGRVPEDPEGADHGGNHNDVHSE